MKARISGHQGSSPTPIFTAVGQLTKGVERLAHTVTLLTAETHSLRKANEALSKRRRAKKTRVRQGGVLIVQDAEDILAQKDVDEQVRAERSAAGSTKGAGPSTARRCGNCGETGHNVRTCQIDAEMSDVYSDK